MKAEEERIAKQRKKLENKLKMFKEYVKECMQNGGFTKIDTGIGTLSLAKSPVSVEIIDEAIIPEEFKTVKSVVSVDKKAIADNFKQNGELIDGVEIHTNNYNLRIK